MTQAKKESLLFSFVSPGSNEDNEEDPLYRTFYDDRHLGHFIFLIQEIEMATADPD